jgi:hypothetical protein
MASLNPTVTVVASAAWVAPDAGVRETVSGGVVSEPGV